MIYCFYLFISLILVNFFVKINVTADSALNRPVPVVIWHGMGDSCCNPNTIGQFKRLIEENIKNVYVYSIQIGNTVFDVGFPFVLSITSKN